MNNTEKKIKKLIDFADDSGLALFDELQEINDGLQAFNSTFDGVEIGGLEAIQGEKGDPGIDGRDGAEGPRGKDGEKGEPGREGYDGFDGRDGKDGTDGAPGQPGKDGSPDSPFEVKAKLESLQGDDRLDAFAIKNLPKMIGKVASDGYPRGLPQPAAAITYQLNGQQVGRGNTLNIVSSLVDFIQGPDKGTYDLTNLEPAIQIVDTTGGQMIVSVPMGSGVGATNAPGSIFLGIDAGAGATFASNSFFLGTRAGLNAAGAYSSTFIGVDAGNAAAHAFQSTFIGQEAGMNADQADNASFIGYQAGKDAINATGAVFIGNQAGMNATNAASSMFMGQGAGFGATDASFSVFMGFGAGANAVQAANSVFLGTNAGSGDLVNNTLGGSSILIGPGSHTGGFSDSIALGAGATNTMSNELYIADGVINVNIAGVHYAFPAVQGGAGSVLTNDGAGNLSWV